jgi:hypothetical protein
MARRRRGTVEGVDGVRAPFSLLLFWWQKKRREE